MYKVSYAPKMLLSSIFSAHFCPQSSAAILPQNAFRCVNEMLAQCLAPQLLRPSGINVNYVPAMTMKKKHWDPQWRKYRKLKIDLRAKTEYEKHLRDKDLTKDESRIIAKKRGIPAFTPWQETAIDMSSTNTIIDEYKPPEADGKSSKLSEGLVKKPKDWTVSKIRGMRDKSLLKKWEGSLDKKALAIELQDIYIDSQKLLQDFKNNKDKMFEYVTENIYPAMTFGLDNKTLRWEFIESIEPPKVVQIRAQNMVSKENYFAQVTVRMHTRQKLAIYDRFGRIMYGSEHLIKDVLEYIVFEKHIVNEYGRWRVHSKIIPTWLPVREPLITTIRKTGRSKSDKKSGTKIEKTVVKETEKDSEGGGGSEGVQLATA